MQQNAIKHRKLKIFVIKGCDISSQSIDDSSHFAPFGLSFRPGIETSMARNDKARNVWYLLRSTRGE
jgi:hypothetical protein